VDYRISMTGIITMANDNTRPTSGQTIFYGGSNHCQLPIANYLLCYLIGTRKLAIGNGSGPVATALGTDFGRKNRGPDPG
jgi:hypothetical protein